MQTHSMAKLLSQMFIGTDDLRRDLSKILASLQRQRGEVVITQHGKPQAVLLDLESYIELLDQIADSDPRFIRRINRALKDAQEGNAIPAEQVFKKLNI